MGQNQYAATFGRKQTSSNAISRRGFYELLLGEMMTGEMFKRLFKRPRQAAAAHPRHTVAPAGAVTATLT